MVVALPMVAAPFRPTITQRRGRGPVFRAGHAFRPADQSGGGCQGRPLTRRTGIGGGLRATAHGISSSRQRTPHDHQTAGADMCGTRNENPSDQDGGSDGTRMAGGRSETDVRPFPHNLPIRPAGLYRRFTARMRSSTLRLPLSPCPGRSGLGVCPHRACFASTLRRISTAWPIMAPLCTGAVSQSACVCRITPPVE